jgi:hypothetical protein
MYEIDFSIKAAKEIFEKDGYAKLAQKRTLFFERPVSPH